MTRHHLDYARLSLTKTARKQIAKALDGVVRNGDPDCFQANNGVLVLSYPVKGRRPVQVEINKGCWSTI